MVFINRPAPADESAGPAQTVRPDSQVLDDGGEGAVTVVEFLDFECEACGAAYPYVEELREQYAGEITYVVRYFPLPGHFNSTNAAVAAEAAARQGKFEEMYHALFQSQSEWGEAGESRAELFRSFAEEIGLDMTTFDRDVADPETTARVQADFAEGQALGVSSTPTFFVNDEQLVDLQSWADVTGAIDAELAQ
ncbi:DsbA family protein [Micromonospora sp. DT81.3]|uniref:DsbA family protein n=1 Tax=Micromonospora sp. DT81.3 TaxID=3416523 RepID=UPI003CFAFA76